MDVTLGSGYSHFASADTVILGGGYDIDADAILGYPPARHLTDVVLRIGAGARIRSGTVIYGGSTIGAGLETGHHVVIHEENLIGENLSIWNHSTIDYGCVLGDRVKIHCGVYVAQFTTLYDDVFLAPGVIVANDLHPQCGRCMRGPTIKRGARIGINVTILPHVSIGEGALIGAGSVVTSDIPAGCVAYGNPARPAKNVDDLPCVFGLVAHPYECGLDVRSRQAAGR
jgi:acetyltransferase-like isoleucine patch superfamily enzyme